MMSFKATSILAIFIVLLFSACRKDETCTAWTADGSKLFEVEGSLNCQEQIDAQMGEYCVCD